MAEVFISYKKEDSARVEPIARALANAGYDVWWDHRIPPGRTYRDVIGAALQSAKCVIVVWSNLSANAQWVLDEADEGKKRNVLLPLLLDDVDIPYGFRQIEAARLVEWNNDPAHPEWRAALEAVSHFVGRAPGGPPKPLVTNTVAPSAAPHVSPSAALKQAAVAPKAEKKSGGATIWIIAGVLAVLLGAGVYFAQSASNLKSADAPVETADAVASESLLGLRVGTAESDGFYRQADGSWVELAPDGVARFRFQGESADGDVAVIFDETRNVRLRLEGGTGAVTEEALNESGARYWRPRYEGGEAVRGPAFAAPPTPAQPSDLVSRVWFTSGGGFVLAPEGWFEISPDNGGHGDVAWREESRDADTIILRDDGRQAGARIELSDGVVYLYFPDWGDWQSHWQIRAIDRGEAG